MRTKTSMGRGAETSQKRSRPAGEIFMTSALDVALDYIARCDLIQDRHTLLTARLVCKYWRSHEAFSGKITHVTFHHPQQLEMLVRYQTGSRVTSRVWPISEHSRVFPNLSGLKLDWTLKQDSEEWPRFPLKVWRECCQYDLSVSCPLLKSILEHLRELGLLRSAMITKVTSANKVPLVLDAIVTQLPALRSLTCLSLTVKSQSGGILDKISALTVLQVVPSLRDLNLDTEIYSSAQLSSLLNVCSSLTSLSSLNLDVVIWNGRMDLHPVNPPTSLSEVCNILQSTPIPCLKTCHIAMPDSSGSYESGKLCNLELVVRLPRNGEQFADLVNPRFTNMLSSAELVRGQTLALKMLLPTLLAWAVQHPQPESLNSEFQVTRLGIISEHSVGSTVMFPPLPIFFQHLQHLHISMFQSDEAVPLSVLTGLSHLTHLTINPSGTRGAHTLTPWHSFPPPLLARFDTAFLPTTLRELDMSAKIFQPSDVLLPQLTSLRLNAPDGTTNPFMPFLHCGAPLRNLELLNQQSVKSIVKAFPRLEKLSCRVSTPSIKPLGRLKLLRELELWLCQDVGMVKGVSSLTQLGKLSITAHHGSFVSLEELRHLTLLSVLTATLRACNYTAHRIESCLIHEMKKTLSFWQDQSKEQVVKFKACMPMTNISLLLLFGWFNTRYHPHCASPLSHFN